MTFKELILAYVAKESIPWDLIETGQILAKIVCKSQKLSEEPTKEEVEKVMEEYNELKWGEEATPLTKNHLDFLKGIFHIKS